MLREQPLEIYHEKFRHEHRPKQTTAAHGHIEKRKESIMSRQRLIPMITVSMFLCLPVRNASGKTTVVNTCLTRGHLIAQPFSPGVVVRRVVRSPVLTPRHHHGKVMATRHSFHHIRPARPHCLGVVVGRRPCVRYFKAFPGRVVNGRSRTGAVERVIVTVWIANSNGSRTAVQLVKRGPGFIGPRGEWYKHMPTVTQLCIAYGF